MQDLEPRPTHINERPKLGTSFRLLDDRNWVGEDELNEWGGRLMGAGRVDEAVAVFALNTQLRPTSFNTWDSLGEGLEAQGREAAAVNAYRRSLALDRSNDHAKARLAVLATVAPK